MVKRVETAIQCALVSWIKANYPHIGIHATMNENNIKHMNMGCWVGITDLLLFKRIDDTLHMLFLELKTKKGKMRDTQNDWHEVYSSEFAANNTKYAVAYGFLEAKEICKKWLT